MHVAIFRFDASRFFRGQPVQTWLARLARYVSQYKPRRVTPVMQMELSECGAACLAMILRRFGNFMPLGKVRDLCGVSRDGMSAASIIRAARKLGLREDAYNLDAAALTNIPMPVIAHWERSHFVVILRVSQSGATIIDPRHGQLRIDFPVLRRSFGGIALSFHPTPAFQRQKPRHSVLTQLRSVMRDTGETLLWMVFGLLILELLSLVPLTGVFVLVDRVIEPGNRASLLPVAAVLLAASVGQIAMRFFRDRMIHRLVFVLDVTLIGACVRHLLRLPLDFFARRTPGDLIQRVQANIELRGLLLQLGDATLDGMLLLAYAAMLLAYDMRLGGLLLGTSVLRIALPWLCIERRRSLAEAESLAHAGEMNIVVEAVSALETVKALGLEARLQLRHANRLTARLNIGLTKATLEKWLDMLVQLYDVATASLFLTTGGLTVLHGEASVGTLLSLLSAQTLLIKPMTSLAVTGQRLIMVRAVLSQINDIMTAEPEPNGRVALPRLRGTITARQLSFGFDRSAKPVCNRLNLEIAAGELLAIVGRSGAGKSTLGKLLVGLLRPTGGSVAIDGFALDSLDSGKFRQQIGIIPQDTFLFDGTLRENLLSFVAGGPTPSVADIHEACRIACLDEMIAGLPAGLDTLVGENGCLLSGGQRQRVALARALVKRPGILLLDEATSALDPATEARVHANLARLNCTRIVITHRLEILQDADRIIVLDDGDMVEEGTYETLARQRGVFRRLLEAEMRHA